jgi:hypothetical protein
MKQVKQGERLEKGRQISGITKEESRKGGGEGNTSSELTEEGGRGCV